MNNGAVAVLDESLQTVITSWQHSTRSISDLKYAPNGGTLGVASHDCNIYLYSVDIESRKYARRAVCTGHSSYVTHLDFSADSMYLQSTSGDYELLFWQSTGNIFRSASKLRDMAWATWTCTLGWPVQGALHPLEGGWGGLG
jgi:WD40 repeat protein